MHIFKMSMFNWKLWEETYVDSVLSHCQHINMIDDSELKQQISSERSRAYLRRTKIFIHKLVFKVDKFCETRSLDEKNVSRLHNIFELKDCFQLNSDNYVLTLINRKMLTDALKKDESLNVSLSDCEELSLLKVKELLICLHEHHRLAATTRYFFQSKQKWWIVNLYLNDMRTDLFSRNLVSLLISSQDLNSSVITALKEAYSNSRNFCDENIFCNLRYCQLRNDETEAEKWMTRLSESKQTDVAQLQNMIKKISEMIALQDVLNVLLFFVSLWSSVSIDVFHRLLTLRCSEVTTAHIMSTLLTFC